MLCHGEHFQESSRLDQLADRSLEDGPSILTGWFAVASHDTSDMLTTSGVAELLARGKGKRVPLLY